MVGMYELLMFLIFQQNRSSSGGIQEKEKNLFYKRLYPYRTFIFIKGLPGKTKEGQAMINHKIPMSSLGAKTVVPQMTILFRSLFVYC